MRYTICHLDKFNISVKLFSPTRGQPISILILDYVSSLFCDRVEVSEFVRNQERFATGFLLCLHIKHKSEIKMFHFTENNKINSVGTDLLSVLFLYWLINPPTLTTVFLTNQLELSNSFRAKSKPITPDKYLCIDLFPCSLVV